MSTERASNRGHMPVSGLPLVEPDQACESCGTQGTVGKVVITTRESASAALHRFCANCWPIESARFLARWKEQRREAKEHLSLETMASSTSVPSANIPPSASSSFEAFGRVRPMHAIGFESATWHHIEETIEKIQELLEMVRTNNVPTEEELEVTAREMAEGILAGMDTRVGRMPTSVSSFLLEFGPDADSPSQKTNAQLDRSPNHWHIHSNSIPHRTRRPESTNKPLSAERIWPAESRASMNEAVAAAHASADEVIAAFDQQLESLMVPTTATERALVETELVGMLEQLHQEIEVERATLSDKDEQMKAAHESGNEYLLQRLVRDNEERVLRLHGLKTTVEDLEQLHRKLLKGVPPAEG